MIGILSILVAIIAGSGRVLAVGMNVTAQASVAVAGESPITNGQFKLQLSGTNISGSGITVSYAVSGSATPGADYQVLSGSAVIPNGSNNVFVPVTIIPSQDDEPEGDEAITITITGTSDLSVTVGSPAGATVTLWDAQSDDDGDSVPDSQELVDGTDRNDQESYKDSDTDMVPDFYEDQATGGGDGNGDGIQDALQADVISVPSPISDGMITFDIVEPGRSFTGVTMFDESELPNPPTTIHFPVGLSQLIINVPNPGDSATVRIIYHEVYDSSDWRMYGAFDDGTIEQFTGSSSFATAVIGGIPRTVGTFTLVDGGVGDEDETADGVIVDPHGPAVLVATPPAPVAPIGPAAPSAPNTGLSRGDRVAGLIALGYMAIIAALAAIGVYYELRQGGRSDHLNTSV